jgi:methylmalonyl-CoA mutase cobalamin-binding subunit
LGALMLALILRRSGLHVAYLGQNVEADALIALVATIRPAAVLLSATLQVHVDMVRDVGRRLSEQGAAHTLLVFGGQVFTQNPELAHDMPGEVLNLDVYEAAREMRRRLST